ncbi:MAG: HEAT repeat domain-containing protein [Isosphaeraceae bacterium]
MAAIWAGMGLIACLSGCQTGPKKFASINDPSPVMRARAVALGENQPDQVAVPALLSRLNDPDPVVRLAAGEALKRRSGQDFGYQPYADPAEQTEAIGKWQGWWQARQAASSRVPAKMTVRQSRRRGIFR